MKRIKPSSPNSLPPLRPYQADDIAAIIDAPRHRKMICHPPGAGKTRVAVEAVRAINAKRILVVAPALARPVWVEEFARWADMRCESVTTGRHTAVKVPKHIAARDAAYAAPVRVTSYALLLNFLSEKVPVDAIIFDEIHNLRDPASKYSQHARRLVLDNPDAAVLGLTATPIPTKTEQAWNPVDTLFPGWHGTRGHGAAVDVPWSFLRTYCERHENEYGVCYTGAKDDVAMQKLRTVLAPYIRRVDPAVVQKYLPPVDAAPLLAEDGHTRRWIAEFVRDGVGEGCQHVAVVAYKRDSAQTIYQAMTKEWSRQFGREGRGVFHFDGAYAVEARAEMIEHFKRAGGVLVCTSESIREAINLSFIKHVLITEWRTSPASALQLLGRFRRPNADPRINRVRYLTLPDDRSRAKLLERRLHALSLVMESDDSHDRLEQVFSTKECSDDELDAMLRLGPSISNEQKELW